MKNEKAGIESRRYNSDFKISATIGQLHEAVHQHKDPIETLRRIAGIGDIAAVLECGPHVYEDHLKHLEAKTPYSPLTGYHVLKLCRKTGVHPADMVSSLPDPHHVCRPHIFSALLMLSRRDKVQAYDRVLANAAFFI
jgi:hypothetical protein